MSKNSQNSFFGKRQLALIIAPFIVGIVVMVMEISSSKFLAPIFGNSVFTWSAIIGAVLLSLSLGSFLGGLQADKTPHPRLLYFFLLIGAIYALLDPIIFFTVKDWAEQNTDLLWGPILMSFLLLAIPICFLGALSPVCIKLLVGLTNRDRIGSATGLISMTGTVGSFIGTLVTGFVLIPHFEIKQIFSTCGLILSIMGIAISLLFLEKTKEQIKLTANYITAFVIVAVISITIMVIKLDKPIDANKKVVFAKSTFYHNIKVVDSIYTTDLGKETHRYLNCDSTTEGGEIVESQDLIIDYQRFWRLAKVFFTANDEKTSKDRPILEKALFLGAGAFGMPKKLSSAFPNAHVDVADIDPAIIEVGENFFQVLDYKKIKTHAEDGRRFLNLHQAKYDFIAVDTYNGLRYIPPHLTTKEFFALVKKRLYKKGILLINIISPLQGENNKVFASFTKTIGKAFSETMVFRVHTVNFKNTQNIIFVAGNKGTIARWNRNSFDSQEGKIFRQLRIRGLQSDDNLKKGKLLTDAKNPIELFLAEQLASSL